MLLLTSYKHISTAGTLSRHVETAPWQRGNTQHGTGRSRGVDIWAAPVLLSQTRPRETAAHASAHISASGGHTPDLDWGTQGLYAQVSCEPHLLSGAAGRTYRLGTDHSPIPHVGPSLGCGCSDLALQSPEVLISSKC